MAVTLEVYDEFSAASCHCSIAGRIARGFVSSRARAGDTATLYGVVQDTSKAILPGVSVTVTHQGTNLTRETVTDGRGEFALPALPAGPYAIRLSSRGSRHIPARA